MPATGIIRIIGATVLVCGFIFLVPVHDVLAVTYESTKSADLAVSAKVNARRQDLEFSLTSSSLDSVISADETVEFTIDYGSHLTYGIPMTIEAWWSEGSIVSDPLTTIPLLSYQAGSATPDYWGESIPVVDTVNRKIVWTVKRFPPNTIHKTVRFKLKTPSRYVTEKQVQFSVHARMYTPEIEMAEREIVYTYDPAMFIRSELKGLQFLSLDVRQITNSSFALFIATSVPTKTVITYGIDPNNLDKTITDATFSDEKMITIDGLLPATTYYYRVLIANERGIEKRTPERLKVTTSSASLLPLLESSRVVVTSRGILLLDGTLLGNLTTLTVPLSTPLSFILPFKKVFPGGVSLTLTNRSVLGISTDPPFISSNTVQLQETQAYTYTGSLTAPMVAGQYDVQMETVSEDGMRDRDILTTLIVTEPLQIVDAKNGRGVERALVYLERYDKRKQQFVAFSGTSFLMRNPSYTDEKGRADIVLPEGEYQMTVHAIGYRGMQINFGVRSGDKQSYPTVQIEPEPFSWQNIVSYYKAAYLDTYLYATNQASSLSSSYRFLDVVLLSIGVLVGLLIFGINLRRLEWSFESVILMAEKRFLQLLGHKEHVCMGLVRNLDTGLPISHATVQLVNIKTGIVLARDLSDAFGVFRLRAVATGTKLLIRKVGYENKNIFLQDGYEYCSIVTLVRESQKKLPKAMAFLLTIVRELIHSLADVALLASWFVCIVVLSRKAAILWPLVILACINTFLWLELVWRDFKRQYK